MRLYARAGADRAELYLYDPIGAGFFDDGITAKTVVDTLKKYEPTLPLDIFINSPGGSVFDGITIYNTLQRWQGRKVVHIDGLAASIASVIAMAGDDIVMARNALMMIHRGWTVCVGNAAELRKMAGDLDTVDETILNTYVTRTGGNRDQILAWMDAETWMSADEARERGFATAVDDDEERETDMRAVNAAFPLLRAFRNTPNWLRDPERSAAGRFLQ